MADPYEWSDERDDDRARRFDRNEEEARRAAQRHADQDLYRRGRRPPRQGGDYGAGWYGEDAFYEGYGVPGPYGRPAEQRDDPDRFDRYPRERDHRSFEEEARHAGQAVGRGWQRLKQGMRHAFEDRPAYERDERFDERRGGGMFGGQDRTSSLFSHDDGLGGRRVGEHRGKGPRGYVRGDDRILEEVSDRLSDDPRLDASDIEVKVEAGEVTLNGQVKAREDKRRAEDIAESVSGVKHLQNNIRVRPPERPAERAADPAATSGQNARTAAATGTLGSVGGDAPAPTSAQIEDQRGATRTSRPN